MRNITYLTPMKTIREKIQALLMGGGVAILVALSTAAQAAYLSDPQSLVSYPNPGMTDIYKELGAYPNFGVNDTAADILFSSDNGIWNFNLSSIPINGIISSAKVRLSMALDDHYSVDKTSYFGKIIVNGIEVFSGKFNDLGAEHGSPYGYGSWSNWASVEFPISNLSLDNNTVEIINETATGGDWIGIDSIMVELDTRKEIKLVINPKSINLRSVGVVDVDILSTNAFDTKTVDSNTVRFGRTGTEATPVKSSLANGKMVLKFDTQKTGIQCGDTSAYLSGRTTDGQVFYGAVLINTVCKTCN